MNLKTHKVNLTATVWAKKLIKVKMRGQTDNIEVVFYATKEEAGKLIELLTELREKLPN